MNEKLLFAMFPETKQGITNHLIASQKPVFFTTGAPDVLQIEAFVHLFQNNPTHWTNDSERKTFAMFPETKQGITNHLTASIRRLFLPLTLLRAPCRTAASTLLHQLFPKVEDTIPNAERYREGNFNCLDTEEDGNNYPEECVMQAQVDHQYHARQVQEKEDCKTKAQK